MSFHTQTHTHSFYFTFFLLFCVDEPDTQQPRPKPWKVISIKDKLLFLHISSLLKISFSSLQNSPQWAVVHLINLPTHNSTQFHAIVFLCLWKSISELQWRLFSIASREADNFVGCLHSIRLPLNKEGIAFSLVLPAFRNPNIHSVESTKLVQILKCLSRKLFILMQTQNQPSQL